MSLVCLLPIREHIVVGQQLPCELCGSKVARTSSLGGIVLVFSTLHRRSLKLRSFGDNFSDPHPWAVWAVRFVHPKGSQRYCLNFETKVVIVVDIEQHRYEDEVYLDRFFMIFLGTACRCERMMSKAKLLRHGGKFKTALSLHSRN